MSKTARQAATGYRPSGRQCAECKHAAEDCSGIDFAAMPQAGRIDKDGVQRVRCMFYERAERVSAADELEHNCCGALASGPHKMGCDYKLSGVPTLEECRVIVAPLVEDIKRRAETKPCRCGPDGCADSVACPRKST